MIPRLTCRAVSATTRRSAGAFSRRSPALSSGEAPVRSQTLTTTWNIGGGGGKGLEGGSGGGDRRRRREECDGAQGWQLPETARTSKRIVGAALGANSAGSPEHDELGQYEHNVGVERARELHDACDADSMQIRVNRNISRGSGSKAPLTNDDGLSERRKAKDDHLRRGAAEGRRRSRRGHRGGGYNSGSESATRKDSWDSTDRNYVHLLMEMKVSGDWPGVIEAYKQASAARELTRVVYNSTIGVLSRSPQWRVALSVFQEMQDAGLTPDAYAFNSAIQACGYGNEQELAFSLFEEMPASGVNPDAYTFNHLIAVSKDKWETALSLMRDMEQSGLSPSNVTYNSVIVACGNGGQPDQAMTLLDEMRDRGVQVTEGTYSAAIAACGKALQWERALLLLDEMKGGRDNLEPNEYCYNSCISACVRASRWAEALELLREMQATELTVRSGVYVQVIKACLGAGELARAEDLADEMHAAGIHVKSSTQAMLARHRKNRGRPHSPVDPASAAWSRTPGLLGLGLDSRILPNQQHGHDWRQATRVSDAPNAAPHATAIETASSSAGGAPPSVLPPRSRQTVREFLGRVSGHAKAMRWAEIDRELDEARQNPKVKVSMRMYEGCIAALASGGRWSEAIGVLEKIHEAGLTPNAKCVTAVIRACARGHPPRWGMAVSLLRGMKKPDVWAYVSTLSAVAKAGQWKTSVSLLEDMRRSGLKPNLYCYNSTLAAFRAGDPPQWRKASQMLAQMRSEGVEPGLTSYTSAIKACLAASELEAAKSVMDDMVEAGHPPAEELKLLVVRASSSS